MSKVFQIQGDETRGPELCPGLGLCLPPLWHLQSFESNRGMAVEAVRGGKAGREACCWQRLLWGAGPSSLGLVEMGWSESSEQLC